MSFMAIRSDDIDTGDDKKLYTMLAKCHDFSVSHHRKGNEVAGEWTDLSCLQKALPAEGESFSYLSPFIFCLVQ